MAFRGVVGGYGFNADVVGYLQLVAILHRLTVACHAGTPLIGDEACLAACQRLDSLLVEVVAMLVGDKDVVGLGHGCVVDGLAAQLPHGVNHQFTAVVLHTDAGMDKGVEPDRPPALGLELVHLVGVSRRHRPLRILPRSDAAQKIDHLVAFRSQLRGCTGRPSAAFAVDGYGLVLGQCGLGSLHEVILLDVDVHGSADVVFLILLGRSHVHHYHVGLGRQRSKALDVGVLVVLLATACCQSKGCQQACDNLSHTFLCYLFGAASYE